MYWLIRKILYLIQPFSALEKFVDIWNISLWHEKIKTTEYKETYKRIENTVIGFTLYFFLFFFSINQDCGSNNNSLSFTLLYFLPMAFSPPLTNLSSAHCSICRIRYATSNAKYRGEQRGAYRDVIPQSPAVLTQLALSLNNADVGKCHFPARCRAPFSTVFSIVGH